MTSFQLTPPNSAISPRLCTSTTTAMETAFHALSLAECFSILNSHPEFGLTSEQHHERLLKYGPNQLPSPASPATWRLILGQFQDRLVQILLFAAVVSLVVAWSDAREAGKFSISMFFEPFVILVILVVNGVIGVAQESGAEKALEALKKLAPQQVKVLRNGILTQVAASSLVPGDLVEVQAGDRIPADGRLVGNGNGVVGGKPLKVDESALTGESGGVSKQIEAVSLETECMDQRNMLFCGTLVVTGAKAKMLVTCTASNTAIGKIHSSIHHASSSAASGGQEFSSSSSPLGRQLDAFGELLAKAISFICFALWALNVSVGSEPLNVGSLIAHFKLSIALAVAAIPEGLSIIITMTLALGTKRMAKRNAIVRKLGSVEALDSCSVICVDKTGTLTCNKMSVTRVAFFSGGCSSMEEMQIEGSGYNPFGLVTLENGFAEEIPCEKEVIWMSSLVACLCNSASPVQFAHANSEFCSVGGGDPTEIALKVWSERMQTNNSTFNRKLNAMEVSERASAVNAFMHSQHEILATLEFCSHRKCMSCLVERHFDSKKFLLVKGAPEILLECSSHIMDGNGRIHQMSLEHKSKLTNQIRKYAHDQALRVLGLAYREISPSLSQEIIKASQCENISDEEDAFSSYESSLVFTSLVGLADVPRPGVAEAVSKCKEAGVRLIVLTGDHQATSESICRQIGLFPPPPLEEAQEEEHKGDQSNKIVDNYHQLPLAFQPDSCLSNSSSFTGKHLDSWNVAQLDQALESGATLFSRVEPRHKQRIVQALKSKGYLVGMTGDGINDAPALQMADIGISMGSGTDVAKLASDIVLIDDNFSTLVAAIEEGRSIYANCQQFIRYLISSNIGEVLAIFIASVVGGIPCLLTPVQLLWVNLVTDGLPATALGFNPPDPSLMHRGPRGAKEPLISPGLFIRYCLVGLWVGIATVAGYLIGESSSYISTSSTIKSQTIALTVMVMLEMFNALNALSETESLLEIPPWKNAYLVVGVVGSIGVHSLMLYVGPLGKFMGLVPLDWQCWKIVLGLSMPVILIEEMIKVFVRRSTRARSDKNMNLHYMSDKSKNLHYKEC